MRFNSPVYWLFLAVTAVILAILPGRLRKAWLLLASYLFYASWHWPYLALLVSCAAFTYLGAKWIDRATGPDRQRRGWVVIGVNLCTLFSFKYLDWSVGNLNNVA